MVSKSRKIFILSCSFRVPLSEWNRKVVNCVKILYRNIYNMLRVKTNNSHHPNVRDAVSLNRKEGTMFRSYVILIVGILFFAPMALRSQSHVNAGVSMGPEGVQGFYFAIGQYYHVPEREVIVVHERQIPDEEVPVVFFIARKAHVAPSAVMDLRLAGKSWWDITIHYGLGPEIFYVPVEVDPGPPYGRAYGYYKHHPRKQWRSVVLTDPEVIDFVNLRFTSDRSEERRIGKE